MADREVEVIVAHLKASKMLAKVLEIKQGWSSHRTRNSVMLVFLNAMFASE